MPAHGQPPSRPLTSTLVHVILPKGLVFGRVGVEVKQRVLRDVMCFHNLEVPDDFVEGDLGQVRLGEGLH